jgi:hypothetical protein
LASFACKKYPRPGWDAEWGRSEKTPDKIFFDYKRNRLYISKMCKIHNQLMCSYQVYFMDRLMPLVLADKLQLTPFFHQDQPTTSELTFTN